MNEKKIGAAVRAAKRTQTRVEISDTDVRGLQLRIAATGTATWVLRCVDREGRQRRFALGRWGIVNGAEDQENAGLATIGKADTSAPLGVSAARDAARQMRAKVDSGADPIMEARQKRAATRDARGGVGTLSAMLDDYAKTDRARKLRTWDECRRRIDSVFARQLGRPLSALTRIELQVAANGWPSPQSAAAAVRYLRPILKWAADTDHGLEDLARIKPPAKVARRDRVLSGAELAALLPVLAASDRPYAAALRFMLLTLARREEVGEARWHDIDLESPCWADLSDEVKAAWTDTGEPSKIATWTIPASNSKNGQAHLVPLSRQAIALLKSRRPEKPKPGERAFGNRDGGLLANWDRETKTIMRASATTDWTRHDLRRTGATMLGKMGVMPDIIESCLNHTSIHSQLAGIYNRSRYRQAVADALQRLAGAFEAIEHGAGKRLHTHATKPKIAKVA